MQLPRQSQRLAAGCNPRILAMANGKQLPQKDASQNRAPVLDSVTSRTKAIALIVMVMEAIFLAAVWAIPEPSRLMAFGIAGLVLIVAIIGLIWVEISKG